MATDIRLDFVGNIVRIGDIVVYNPPYYKGLREGTVVKFTPQGFTVTTSGKQTTTIFDCVKRILNG